MSYCNCLADHLDEGLIFDTSVIINLSACGVAEQILDAIPNRIFFPGIVQHELKIGTARESSERRFLNRLESSGRLEMLDMEDADFSAYQRLISGPKSLGDGEAATIALACSRNLLPVIDERKGRRRLVEEDPALFAATTVDIFLHPAVTSSVGIEDVSEAIFNALHSANMSVLKEQLSTIVQLIGPERSRLCRSLPGYKRLIANPRRLDATRTLCSNE